MNIIHIGQHKTGSTYLQNYYFPQLDDVLFENHAKLSASSWLENVYGKPNTLISSEIYSGLPWVPNIRGMSKEIDWLESFKLSLGKVKRIYPSFVPIIFFRSHGDMALSMYKQFLQIGGTLKFDEFFGEGNIIEPYELSIKARIDILNCLFDDFHTLDYNEWRLNGDVYLDKFFENIFGIRRFDSDSTTLNIKPNSNRGVSGHKMEMLRFYNRVYYNLPGIVQRLLKLSKYDPRGFFQTRLNYWNTPDTEMIISRIKGINDENKEDWNFFVQNSSRWKIDVNKTE